MKTRLLLIHSRELLTMVPQPNDPLGLVDDGAVAMDQDRIVALGRTDEVMSQVSVDARTSVLDVSEKVVMPGFIDSHTHLVHAGSRAEEFARRVAGEEYLTILKNGGGILSTVRATRAASSRELALAALGRLRQMLAFGTTTAEVKSGYGLDLENELKILRVVAQLQRLQPLTLIPTFLGAHALPSEYCDRPDAYVDLVCSQMIPKVAENGLAHFCDVFCEQGVFTVDQSLRVLQSGNVYGLTPRLHADELSESGAAKLAAEVSAVSADHVTFSSAEGFDAMAKAGVLVVLLPGASFFLDHPYAPARDIIDKHRVDVALATDYNPGTSPILSMPTVISLACAKMRMSVAEAVVASTRTAARVLGLSKEVGTIEVGKKADVLVLDLSSHKQLVYGLGFNPVAKVIKNGRVVVDRDGSFLRGSK